MVSRTDGPGVLTIYPPHSGCSRFIPLTGGIGNRFGVSKNPGVTGFWSKNMIYNVNWKIWNSDFGHCEKNAMTTQRALTSFSPQVLGTSQRSPLGHPLGRFFGGLGRGGTSFRDTV
eukprot:sb/3476608/